MQSFTLLKTLNQKCEEPNGTPYSIRALIPGQQFSIDIYPIGDTNRNNGLSTHFLFDIRTTCSIINCVTNTEIKKT